MRLCPILASLLLVACGDSDSAAATSGTEAAVDREPVSIYVSLDEQFSRRLLDGFAAELDLELKQRHDSESQKTVGLTSALLEERGNPRCSVFWNNEIANTAMLAQKGIFEPYESPSAEDIPVAFRDPQHRWTGFAARARVLIVNTELLPDPQDWPRSYLDLCDPKWKGRCAIAKPLTGTTLTHFAALQTVLGNEQFEAWLDGMVENDVDFLQSNGATMRAVRDGKKAFAFTDTDDTHVARLRGFPVACVFPDQQEGGIGTMLIPNSIALVKGGPNPEGAKRLIDKILARETEALLSAADSAQIPLREGVPAPKDKTIKPYGTFRQLQWDVEATAKNLAPFLEKFGKRFAG